MFCFAQTNVRDSRVANTQSGVCASSRSHLQFCTRALTLLSLSPAASSISSFALFFGFLHQESCLLVCKARAAPERVALKGGFASPARLEWCLTWEDAGVPSPHVPWPEKIPPTRLLHESSALQNARAHRSLCPPSSCIQICSRARTHTHNPRSRKPTSITLSFLFSNLLSLITSHDDAAGCGAQIAQL